jgi:AcrR family transcriptional regulator
VFELFSPYRGGVAATDPDKVRRRADAERNIAAILDAAIACLSERPQATMADIARAAGVGRVTLYGHFPSREALVGAALDRAVAEVAEVSDAVRDAVPADAPADEVLRRHIRSSWDVLDRHRQLFTVAQRVVPPERVRARHDPAFADLESLIARGRAEGRFRPDLSVEWLVTVVYSLFHAAAEAVNDGRLERARAADVLEATILPALAAGRPGGASREKTRG